MTEYRFPEEVKKLASKGLFNLFFANDGSGLMAKDKKNCYLFSSTGQFIEMKGLKEVDVSKYTRISIVGEDQVRSLWKGAGINKAIKAEAEIL